MQIPFWAFLTSLLIAVLLPDMASVILWKRGASSGVAASSWWGSWNSTYGHHIKFPSPSYFSSHLSSSSSNRNHQFSSSSNIMSTNQATPFLETLASRRTIYQLTKKSPISDKRIEEIATEVLKHTPSSFNSQSERFVLVVGDEHDRFWDVIKEVSRGLMDAEKFARTEKRVAGFKAAYGTVCFLFLYIFLTFTLSSHFIYLTSPPLLQTSPPTKTKIDISSSPL